MLENENILLRPIEKEDIEYLNRWKNDESIYKYLGGGFAPISKDQQNSWLDSMIDMLGNSRRFIICDKRKCALGLVGLYNINWIHRTCEIGIYIGEKEMTGKGYGKASIDLIEKYAYEYLNIRKIKAKVVSENIISLKMFSSLKYDRIGEYKDERYIKGIYCNLVLFEKFLN